MFMTSSGKILLTTSRNPTPRIRILCKDLARVVPDIVRVNRGKMSVDEVAEKAIEQGANHVVIVDRWQGGPGKIEFYRIGSEGLVLIPPILHVAGIRLRRELTPTKMKPVRSLVITQSDGGSNEIAESLSKFLNIPVVFENEELPNHQTAMNIAQDAAGQSQITFILLPQKVEIGPRITLRRAV